MANKQINLKLITFIIAIITACVIQILIYLTPPAKENEVLQMVYLSLFYIPMIFILITFPRPNSVKRQILVINLLVFCLILASMNVDYQVLRIFSLPGITHDLIWNKAFNLYWAAWMFQISIVFMIFAILYRFKTNETWIAFRIGCVGPLISFFSFEDIIYYPMHGENPFSISEWSWLPQHNIYFGRPINTIELIWIVSIAMVVIFFFLVTDALRKKPDNTSSVKGFTSPNEKRIFLWSIPLTIGAFCGYILIYLNTNITNDRIPIYLLLFFTGIVVLFIIFSSYFPKIKSRFRQLVLIFVCYIVFWIAATEMDWHAVERGFHWLDDLTPPGDFWVWCNYRMAMWLIYLPITIMLISLMFKLIGNSRQATLKLSITNYLILIMGVDSIFIFLIAGGTFPSNWTWSNFHYSIFHGAYSLPLLIGFALVISIILLYIHKKIRISNDQEI
ncbi:MAG: hypothetical protein HWN66_03375 [Candidatus Helarchaeota archaeon]|nr:hypothetical protein [Candidatus Helarchaeota archaeon]